MPNKNSIKTTNVVGASAGKTLSSALAYSHGVTDVLELNFSDASQLIVKFSKGVIEVGGTNELGTGTVQK